MKRLACLLLSSVLWCTCSVLYADDALHYNQVSLSAQASEQVSNDTMHVTLNSFGEGRDAALVARQINQDMAWALSVVKAHPDIRAATGSYQTWPVTSKDNSTTTGWRGQQTLELESLNSEQLGKLTGELQQRLRINGMRFTVSEDRHAKVENHLIDAALNAFKARAKRAAGDLGARDYRIVSVAISSSAQPPPVLYRSSMAMAAAAPETGVPVESGESKVSVMVSGTIELVMP